MKNDSILILCIFSVLFFLLSCQESSHTPDISNISIKTHIFRFDKEFMDIDTLQLEEGLQELDSKYPLFFPIYMNKIMQFHYSPQNKEKDTLIKDFITGKDILQLQHTIDQHFTDKKIEYIQKELTKSFRYTTYYFRDFKAPKVITFMSALSNYGAVTIDSILGIGLDMFLGEDFPLYQEVSPPYPQYLLRRFNEENLVPSCMKVIAQDMFPLPEKGTLLDQMIAHGKILYFMDKVLPKTADSLKIDYTQKQIDWCENNQQLIWQYFISKKLLYNKKPLTIRYYIGVSPSTRGMPAVAPGNIGSWVGWQIVRKYMKKRPKTTLSELMKMKNSQAILTQSTYQPH